MTAREYLSSCAMKKKNSFETKNSHQMKVVESLASEAFLLSKKRPEVSAQCTRLNDAGQEHGIDAEPSEHVNVARNAWKVPLHIYNLTSDISILNIRYLHSKKFIKFI